jgi:citrate lyase subunit beta/citryl-CoA lyase
MVDFGTACANITVFVWVNSLGTGLTTEDLKYVVCEGLDGIILPKSASKEDITRPEKLIEEEEKRKGMRQGSVSIISLVESPKGVSNARVALGFGAGDFMRELGGGFVIAQLSPEEYFPMILYARSRISVGARVAELLAIDTPYFGLLIGIKGLVRESEKAKLLGFAGKMVIHQIHVEPVNARASRPQSKTSNSPKISWRHARKRKRKVWGQHRLVEE